MNEHERIAREWLACADALRQARSQIYRLIAAGELAVLGRTETATVLCDGLNVAVALEVLAQRIASKE
jgi:hypothetical protein